MKMCISTGFIFTNFMNFFNFFNLSSWGLVIFIMHRIVFSVDIKLLQSLNHKEGNLKVHPSIRSRYHIVTNPSTTLLYKVFSLKVTCMNALRMIQTRAGECTKEDSHQYLRKNIVSFYICP